MARPWVCLEEAVHHESVTGEGEQSSEKQSEKSSRSPFQFSVVTVQNVKMFKGGVNTSASRCIYSGTIHMCVHFSSGSCKYMAVSWHFQVAYVLTLTVLYLTQSVPLQPSRYRTLLSLHKLKPKLMNIFIYVWFTRIYPSVTVQTSSVVTL